MTQMQSALPDRHSLSGQGSYVVSSSPAEHMLSITTQTLSAVLKAVLDSWYASKKELNLQALCTLVCHWHNLNYTGQRLMVIAPATASANKLS